MITLDDNGGIYAFPLMGTIKSIARDLDAVTRAMRHHRNVGCDCQNCCGQIAQLFSRGNTNLALMTIHSHYYKTVVVTVPK